MFEEAGFALAAQLERMKSVFANPRYAAAVLQHSAARLSPTCFGSSRLFDAAVCSPPYATALPYIDTQRLSIVWLGLAHPRDLRHLEGALTGNRECSEQQRSLWNRRAQDNIEGLPDKVARFCRLLHEAIGPRDGFRRIAVPGLLYKYFVDMRATFRAVRSVLKPGAPFALVVGHNRTSFGGVDSRS
jgi:site-specific DNA-methyltransferase (cytosine-N4-specific)